MRQNIYRSTVHVACGATHLSARRNSHPISGAFLFSSLEKALGKRKRRSHNSSAGKKKIVKKGVRRYPWREKKENSRARIKHEQEEQG